MLTKTQIIDAMCHAAQLIEQYVGPNEIADELIDATDQLEYEWAAQLREEEEEAEEEEK